MTKSKITYYFADPATKFVIRQIVIDDGSNIPKVESDHVYQYDATEFMNALRELHRQVKSGTMHQFEDDVFAFVKEEPFEEDDDQTQEYEE